MTEESAANPRSVMVIHGRNEALRESMFQFLRSLDLDPIEWERAIRATGSASPDIREVVNAAFDMAQAVVALMTGDDVAKLRPEFLKDDDPSHERELTPQPRANVLFEAGMALATHRDRTVLVTVGKVRPFSDISGLHLLRLNDSAEKRGALAGRLESAGCAVNRQGSDWYRVGKFGTDSDSIATSQENINQVHEQDFTKEEIEVLKVLFEDGELNAIDVSELAGVSQGKAQFFLEELSYKNVIERTWYDSSNGEWNYKIRPGHLSLFRRIGVVGQDSQASRTRRVLD